MRQRRHSIRGRTLESAVLLVVGFVLRTSLCFAVPPDDLDSVRVGIDPGHGGSDPGAQNELESGQVLDESYVNWETAVALVELVEAMNGEAVQTKFSLDENPGYTTRGNILNAANCQIKISVHHNVSENDPITNHHLSLINTLECSHISAVLGDSVVKSLDRLRGYGFGQDHCSPTKQGVRETDRVTFLKVATEPVALAEVSFISCDEEAERLNDSYYRNENAWALYAGICRFVGVTPCDMDDYECWTNVEAFVQDVHVRDGFLYWTSARERGSKAYRVLTKSGAPGNGWEDLRSRIPATGSGSHYKKYIGDSPHYVRLEESTAPKNASAWSTLGTFVNEEWPPEAPLPEYKPRPLHVHCTADQLAQIKSFVKTRANLGLHTTYELHDSIAVRDVETIRASNKKNRELNIIWRSSAASTRDKHFEKNADFPKSVVIVAPETLNVDGAIYAYGTQLIQEGWQPVHLEILEEPYPSKEEIRNLVDGYNYVVLFGNTQTGNGSETTIPVWFVPDPDSVFAHYTDNIPSLYGYEGTPRSVDRRVGYFLAHRPSSVWRYYDKRVDYWYNWPWYFGIDNGVKRRIGLWANDLTYAKNSDEALRVYMNDASGYLHPGWEREFIWASELPDSTDLTRHKACLADLMKGRSLVAALATQSGSYYPANMLKSTFHLETLDSLVDSGQYTHFVIPSCSAARFDSVGANKYMAKGMMNIQGGGAITCTGPTRGHYPSYYYQYLREFFRQYSIWPGHADSENPTIGELHANTKNALLATAAEDSAMVILCQEMVLLGDPTTEVWGPLGENYIVAVPGEDVPKTRFALLPTRPNPFNPTTQILFSIPEGGPVDVSVYNVAGRLVKVLVNSDLQAGEHRVEWDGTNEFGNEVGSGIYFCRLESGNDVSSKRMVLIR